MRIAVECYPDKVLVKTLEISEERIVHTGSKARVVKRVTKYADTIGIIDEDPGKPRLRILRSFTASMGLRKYGIIILQKNNQRIIMLSPRLKEFILEAYHEAQVDQPPTIPKSILNTNRSINIERTFPKRKDLIQEAPFLEHYHDRENPRTSYSQQSSPNKIRTKS